MPSKKVISFVMGKKSKPTVKSTGPTGPIWLNFDIIYVILEVSSKRNNWKSFKENLEKLRVQSCMN